jgi:Mn2+/Fe2+ NRAMP family transporter
MFTLHKTRRLPCVCIIAEKVKQTFSQNKMQIHLKDPLHHYTHLKVLLGSGATVLVALALLFSGDIRLAVLNALISYVLCKLLDSMQHTHRKEAGDH